MIRVCSGFSPSGYISYGKTFLECFHRHWPASVDLVVYGEEPVPMPRGRFHVLSECNGISEFIARHKDNPEANGRKPRKGWRDREIANGYCFRFDTLKFSKQCFIPEAASLDMADGDILVWSDGDVIAFADIPKGFVENRLQDFDLCFLGRTGTHSEIGFWAVRLNPGTRAFLKSFAEIWRNDTVFQLPEWHSAFVFDHCRKESSIKQLDLTPGGRGHVFDMQSPLRHYMTHLKGDERKRVGPAPQYRRPQ